MNNLDMFDENLTSTVGTFYPHDKITVNTIDDILSYLETKKVGDTVQLTILRDGQVENVPVQLGPSSVAAGSTEFPLGSDDIQPLPP